MPLITLAHLCLAVGMLLGLSGYVSLPLVAAAVACAIALLGRRPTLAAAAVLFSAGDIAAAGASELDSRCRRIGGARAIWDAEILADAHPRSITRARWTGGRCRIPLTIEVLSGSAPAGSRIRVEGRGLAGPKGIVVRGGRITAVSPGAVLARWRARTGRRIDALFGADAPLARALIIAEQGALPPRLRDQYADAGLVHLLSVSGLHVAIVAGTVHLLLSMLRMRASTATIGGAVLTAAYVALIGAPPAALRAGGMLAAMALGKVLQRPVSPWALLSLGALLPLHDPRVAGDLGYQLSVAGMAAVVCSGLISRRMIAPRLDGLRRKLAAEMTTALLAAAVTGPLVAAAFGRLSLVSPFANLVAAPLIALAQPALFLAVALSPLGSVASLAADGARVPLALLDVVATTAAGVPFAAVAVAPRSVVSAFLLAGCAGLLVACASVRPWRGLAAACLAGAAAAWWPMRGSGRTELHMLDVGQGDAIALRSARGRWIVIDAGRAWEGGDAGTATVVPYVRRLGGEVAAFILSHPHSDHAGGAASVIRALRPRLFLDPSFAGDAGTYHGSLEAAFVAGVPWRRAEAGGRIVVDEVTVDLLAPDSAWLQTVSEPNDASVIALVRVGAVRFLLTGDAEAGAERRLIARGEDVRADVLKAGHHGSSTSSVPELLDAVRPRIALLSVGALNRYGHPAADVLRSLAGRGTFVVRTDESGTVVLRTDGRTITVETEEETWELPPARWRD